LYATSNSNKECTTSTTPPVVREHKLDGKNYIVKRDFVGDKDIKVAILKLAEKKAMKEMGLDTAFG
jgi:hypothetical protein